MKIGKEFLEVLAKRRFKRMSVGTEKSEISVAMHTLQKAIQKDPEIAYSWHANIAMAMHDAMPESFWMPDRTEHLKIANEGASRFMKIAFDVETSQDMLRDKEDV